MSPVQKTLAYARQAQELLEFDPLPTREVLSLIIRAVLALAHSLVQLEDQINRNAAQVRP